MSVGDVLDVGCPVRLVGPPLGQIVHWVPADDPTHCTPAIVMRTDVDDPTTVPELFLVGRLAFVQPGRYRGDCTSGWHWGGEAACHESLKHKEAR
jgi:hypothetical protein